MRPIANPFLNDRSEASFRYGMGLPTVSQGYPSLEGRSNMQDDWDDNEETPRSTDDDLMPDTPLSISPETRAFQESGHGYSIKEAEEGQ